MESAPEVEFFADSDSLATLLNHTRCRLVPRRAELPDDERSLKDRAVGCLCDEALVDELQGASKGGLLDFCADVERFLAEDDRSVDAAAGTFLEAVP